MWGMNGMEIALQFGAGNIGRGFMGQLFWEAGLYTVQVDSNVALVELINSRRSYTLTLLNAYTKQVEDIVIDRVEAASVAEKDRIARLFAQAEVAATAVGLSNLPAVATLIASGIAERKHSGGGKLDIFVCENAIEAAQVLKRETFQFLDPELQGWAESVIGFVGASVARMVPPRSDRYGGGDPLSVVADAYRKLPYDGPASRAEPLACPWMHPVRNFRAEMERKFYTHNLGHAALGYLGYLRGFQYVHEPFDDELCRTTFDGALDETSSSLLLKYPADLDPTEHHDVRADARVRFANSLLQDTVTRVAREPIRKLRPEDRLIGSVRLCLAQQVFPRHIYVVVGGALLYDDPKDIEAMKLRSMIETGGVAKTLHEITGVAPESPEGQAILEAYSLIRKHKKTR
jgi:mannitol-1-phosphate 5-dehydrogenase